MPSRAIQLSTKQAAWVSDFGSVSTHAKVCVSADKTEARYYGAQQEITLAT